VNEDMERYMELVKESYNGDIILKCDNLSVKNNSKINFWYVPIGTLGKLKIWSGNYINKGTLIAQTNLFPVCYATNVSINVTIINPIIKIEFEGKCPGGRILKPSGDVYFREENAGSWRLLGYATNGYISSNELIIGKTYVFGAALNGFYMSILHTGKITQVDNFIRCDLPDGTTACD
jgi:hypothetical protein